MLAVGMLLITVLQTAAIPSLNAQHEFQHNQEVQNDLVRFETTIDRVAATDTGETATIAVGLRYPPRLIFINPPPVSGSLQTTGPATVQIENAVAAGETGDYWDGSQKSIPTKTVRYTPDYNEYGSAPVTVYEPWAVYNQIDGQTIPLTGSDVVDGRRISLVALDGEFQASKAGTVGVDTAPTSAAVRTVTVRNETQPITLTLPTGLRKDTWDRLLADEFDQPGIEDDRQLLAIDCRSEPPEPCGALKLTLEPGTYEFRLGEVGVGSNASRDPAVYLTDVEGTEETVPVSGRQRIVVEARDRFDNPVSGVTVTASLGGAPGALRPVTPVTDAQGHAVFVYEAPESIDSMRSVTVTTQFGSGDAQRTVTHDLQVLQFGSRDAATSVDAVSPVEGTVDTANIAGRDRGREVSFTLQASQSVTLTGFSVTTQNELAGRPFTDRGTTFDGGELPVTIDGEFRIVLQDIDTSTELPVGEFVAPTSDTADIVISLEFADGRTQTVALG